MKVHLNQIPPQGLHIEGEKDAKLFDLRGGPQHVKPLGPVRYSLDVGLSDGGLFATGTLAVLGTWFLFICAFSYAMAVASQIYLCVLYRFATSGVVPQGYTPEMLTMAWRPKKAWSR